MSLGSFQEKCKPRSHISKDHQNEEGKRPTSGVQAIETPTYQNYKNGSKAVTIVKCVKPSGCSIYSLIEIVYPFTSGDKTDSEGFQGKGRSFH
jgi:hypothetical protein